MFFSFPWLLSGAVSGGLCFFLSSSVVSDKRSRLTYILSIFLEWMQGDCYPESLRSISLPFRLHGHTFCLGPGDHSLRLLQ